MGEETDAQEAPRFAGSVALIPSHPPLQISLLLSPWRALRSGSPDKSMRHPPEAEFAQAPEISLLEGVSQNPPGSVPLLQECLLAGTRKLVARTRWKKEGLHWHLEGFGPAHGYPGSVLGCLPPQAVCSLARSRGAPLPCVRGSVRLCPPLMSLSVGTYGFDLAGQLTCKHLGLYLHCGQSCCSIAFLISVCNTFSDWK